MFTSDLVAPVIETTASRYDRDWKHIKDTRKVRGLDYQSSERRSRRYVPAASLGGDLENGITGSVVVQRDTVPADFSQATFEASLEYIPS